jgi:hypothetical protein
VNIGSCVFVSQLQLAPALEASDEADAYQDDLLATLRAAAGSADSDGGCSEDAGAVAFRAALAALKAVADAVLSRAASVGGVTKAGAAAAGATPGAIGAAAVAAAAPAFVSPRRAAGQIKADAIRAAAAAAQPNKPLTAAAAASSDDGSGGGGSANSGGEDEAEKALRAERSAAARANRPASLSRPKAAAVGAAAPTAGSRPPHAADSAAAASEDGRLGGVGSDAADRPGPARRRPGSTEGLPQPPRRPVAPAVRRAPKAV